jgi:hypothetical protein
VTERRASVSDAAARVDELRRQLRTLGYLDAGVDRFVLGPAQAKRSPVVIALLASIRSGIVAGALLGPAAALGLGGRLPGLVTGIRDAIVIAIYLAVLFGAAVTILSFVAALVVSAAARSAGSAFAQRGRALSTAAGGVVSVACLAYLTLWWRTANAGFGWGAPIWTAFALVVAVAISLLLGHVVTLTARAVMMARTPSGAPTPRVPGTSWKLAVSAGIVAFAGAASLLVLTAESPRSEATIPLTVRSSGIRVTVLAIDGFDPHLYEQLRPGAATSTAPLLFSAFDRARAELAPEDSRDPARLWTTIATGRRPEAHGVERLETRRVAGLQGRLGSDSIGRLLGGTTDLLRLTRPAIASNVERRVKTFWEVAAQAGLRTGVVNWWATWPADPSAGTVISDRAILRLERGGALDAELAPPELYEQLKAGWPKLHADARAWAARLFATGWTHPPPLTAEVKAILTRSAELDASMIMLARHVGVDLDLLVVYLPGLDIAQQALFGDVAPAPSEVNDRLAALRLYYHYLDSLARQAVGRAVSEKDRAVFVVTQPGRLHQGKGILASLGGGSATAQTTATVLDVAPTILHALGVPVARDLDGRVIEALFAPASLTNHPVRGVDTYGLKATVSRPRTGQPLDEEALERLRSLGYVR